MLHHGWASKIYAQWHSQTQKGQVLYDSIYWGSPSRQTHGDKVDDRLPGAKERGEPELVFDGYGVSVWDDEKVLEIDAGDGCTTEWVYSVPLIHSLKNA